MYNILIYSLCLYNTAMFTAQHTRTFTFKDLIYPQTSHTPPSGRWWNNSRKTWNSVIHKNDWNSREIRFRFYHFQSVTFHFIWWSERDKIETEKMPLSRIFNVSSHNNDKENSNSNSINSFYTSRTDFSRICVNKILMTIK